jgi:hypothetical protein
MSLCRTLLLTLCAASAAVATPALARPHSDSAMAAITRSHDEIRLAWLDRPRDQDRAYMQKQRGESMPLPQIERRVLPRMGGADYLGPEMRGRNLRMKFMDQGKVIWVDVDPLTGRIIGKSGD